MAFQVLKIISLIKRDSINIRIDSDKTASRLVINQKIAFNKIKQHRANSFPSHFLRNSKATDFHSRITSDTFFIHKPMFTKTVKLSGTFKIRNRHTVISQAKISNDFAGLLMFIHISNSNKCIAIMMRLVYNEVVQICISTIKCSDLFSLS